MRGSLRSPLIWSKLASCRQISDIVSRKASQLFVSCSNSNACNLVHLIRVSANNGLFSHGEQLHSHTLKAGLFSNVFISTALINFYVKFELVRDAHYLFAEIPEPSVGSWNSLISGYVHSGHFRKALELFCQLEKSNIYADSYSFTAALCACGQLGRVRVGRTLHSKIVKYGVECSVFVSNCLIDMYGKCGYAADAAIVFQDMIEKDDISWNSILSANARNGKLKDAVAVFDQMPNRDTISYNELINGIAKFGEIDEAIDLLSKMPSSNSSSWNSIITGYANRGRNREALSFFYKMHQCGVRLDEFTLSSLLSGIARLSSIVWGSSIHGCAIKNGLDGYVVVGSALTDMYFKCGKIQDGERSFQSLQEKNLVTWNVLISGYAHNGKSEKVLELFATKEFEPDEITFLNVLSACLHSRAPLKIAKEYFQAMTVDYKIDPTVEHCSMMIKIMGNEGDVSGAEQMISELGFDSCGIVWKTLLAACVSCRNIEAAEAAAKKVMDLDRDDEFVYVMMSNMYACYGKWEDVCGIRMVMKVRNVRKEAAQSWIHIEERS